jgi:hypothetical protein
MGRCRVVAPEIVRLSLSEGEFLDVQKELNAGQYWDLLAALADRQKFAKPIAYLVGWSLVGLNGQPLPYDLDLPEETRRSTLGALDKATLREITAALDRHEAAEQAALDAKKKTSASAPVSSPTPISAAP